MPAALRTWPCVALGALALHALFAWHHRDVANAWTGVPNAPPATAASLVTLGDAQLFYRAATFSLQNMGDQGGRVTPLIDYDYDRLSAWFDLLDGLDPAASYAPTLAAFYFSQTPSKDDLRSIVGYLSRIGSRDPSRNWRWLAHAVYLARHRLGDLPLALEVAQQLAGLAGSEAPVWVRQMPAFVLAAVGEREAADDLLQTILATDPNLSVDEIAFMQRFIAER